MYDAENVVVILSGIEVRDSLTRQNFQLLKFSSVSRSPRGSVHNYIGLS